MFLFSCKEKDGIDCSKTNYGLEKSERDSYSQNFESFVRKMFHLETNSGAPDKMRIQV